MKGDFTRSTFDRTKHYNSVLTQQGRLPMDADWNEAQAISAYLDETTRVDVIGPCGFPEDTAGFELIQSAENLPALSIGRGYVGGILCENENADPTDDTPVLLTEQPGLPGYSLPEENVTYVAYLDVWKRHITALEDPNIKEVALGGLDTATRLQTVWQVKLAPLTDPDQTCADFGPGWLPAEGQGTSQLRSRAELDPLDDRPCIVNAQAGYRRLENQLYRVEIHQSGDAETATFKWSRDNGSIVSSWSGPDTPNSNTLTVTTIGRDNVLRFKPDQWVELSDDTRELSGTPGSLVRLEQADGQTLGLSNGITASRTDFPLTPKVRRWDHQATVAIPAAGAEIELALTDGALPIVEGAWIVLEDGVQVWFEPGGTYHTGDCWMIPARTIGADVLWPQDDAGEPLLSEPHCSRHHYCALGLIEKTDDGWNPLQDCRPLFPPLTDLPEGGGGCCLRVEPGEDVQRAVDQAIAAGGGCLCLGHGIHTVEGPLQLRNANNISISGETPITTLRLIGTDAAGYGGIVLQNTTRITFQQLLIVGRLTPAVLHLQASDGEENSNRNISVRKSTLINRSIFDNQSPPPCAILASDAQQVSLETTRLIAPIGILSRLGDRLPDEPLAAQNNSDNRLEENRLEINNARETALRQIDFSEVPIGTQFRLDEAYSTNNPTATFKPFVNQDKQSVENGFAETMDSSTAASQQRSLQLNSISFQLDFARPAERVSFAYIHGPISQEAEGFPNLGNLNIAINGNWQNLRRLSDLNGQVIDGVTLIVNETTPTDTLRIGTLTLVGPTQELRIGGKNLLISNLRFAQALARPTQVPTDIRLQDVTILYQRYGIWAIAADQWQITDCTLRPGLPPATDSPPTETPTTETPTTEIPTERPAEPPNASDTVTAARSQSSALTAVQQFMIALDEVLNTPSVDFVDDLGSDTLRGTVAIKAFLWDHCQILNSSLSGEIALEAQICLHSQTHHNHIISRTIGLYAFWLYKAQWTHNKVVSLSGAAFAWVGSYRTQITHNQVRNSQVGITNIESGEGRSEMANHIQEIRRYYTNNDDTIPLVSWLLLTQLIPKLGLESLVLPLQNLLTQLNISVPALYFLGIYFYPALTRDDNDSIDQLLASLIGLQIEQNDIEASVACIRCRDFWTLGGLIVRENRLHTVTGQALLLNANPFVVNAHLVSFLWRYIMAQLPVLIANAISTAQNPSNENNPALRAAFATLLQALNPLVTGWVEASEGCLELDYRIESNRLRSLESAIATNLFEIAILNNHITLQEHTTTTEVLVAIVESLSTSPALAPVALAIKDGSQRELKTAVATLKTENTLSGPERASAVTALSGLNNRVGETNLDLQASTTELITALSNSDTTATTKAIDSFQQSLSAFVNSYGILLEGIGGRIIGNHILAPADASSNTWSRGGIHLSSNLRNLFIFVLVANLLQAQIFEDDSFDENNNTPPVFDPLLGITETLIDNNEILGGIGHGIGVQGNDILEILFKLKIRNNQIGGMGGAGIFINEDALVVNLDIESNRIADCANQSDIADLINAQGGLQVEGALFCRIQQNRINACGNDETRKIGFYAVTLKNIIDLTFTGNNVQYNRFGGVSHENIFGTVSVNNNEIFHNNGTGFSWENAQVDQPSGTSSGSDTLTDSPATGSPPAATSDFLVTKQAITPALAIAQFNQLNSRLTNQAAVVPTDQVRASVQNNQFHVPDNQNFLAFRLLNLSELIFSGNMASRPSQDPVGLIDQIGEGIIANNLLRNRV